MAGEVLFEVDASKIVAKLHLAGLMAARSKFSANGKGFIVNTGIVNDQPNGTPEKVGKTEFNLKNPTGEYQVGYIATIEYKKPFDLEKRINAIEKIVAMKNGEKSKIDDKEDKAKNDELESALSYVKQLLPAVKDDVYDGLSTDAYESSIKTLKDEAKKISDSSAKDYEEYIKKTIESIYLQILLPYMETFAGAENVKMNANDIATCAISEAIKDSSSKGLVSNMFKIEPMQEAEQKKLEATFRQNLVNNPDKQNCKHKMCFYVNYTLNVDK